MPVLKIQRELCHSKCARQVSGLQGPVSRKSVSRKSRKSGKLFIEHMFSNTTYAGNAAQCFQISVDVIQRRFWVKTLFPLKRIRENLLHFFIFLNFNEIDCKQYHSLLLCTLNKTSSVCVLCVNLYL